MLKQLNIEQIDQLQSYIEERRVVMNPALIGRVSAVSYTHLSFKHQQ